VTQRALALARSLPGLAVVIAASAIVLGLASANAPDVALGVTLSPVVVGLLAYWVYRHVARHRDAGFLVNYFTLGLAVRVVAVAGQLVIGFFFYRGEVDFVNYWHYAQDLFNRIVLEGQVYLLFDDQYIKDQFFARSALIVSLMVLAMMVLVGPNIIALFLIGVPVSAASAYIFYRAFEHMAPDEATRRRFGRFMWFFPSLAFWSVFLGKDVWIFFFMATTTLALARFLQQARLGTFLALAGSLTAVTVLRPHVGATVLTAVVAALVFRPLPMYGPLLYIRPVVRLVLMAVLVTGFMVVAEMALQTVGVKALTLQALADRAYLAHIGFSGTTGGSALDRVIDESTPAAVAMFIPLGVITLLFRPFLFEAHNVVALVAGIENLVFLAIFVVRLPSIWRAVTMVRRQPLALYALLAFGLTAVALSFDWNLGAAQRHRTMVLPFIFMLLALPGRAPRETPPR
jgi:hypothetical protein